MRTTRAARDTAAWLRERGVSAEHYHGRRRAADRERVERGFADGTIRVVVATNAFGLGIDVTDVRFVVHRHAPAGLDDYHQEAGRAGRDGRPARCSLIYRPAALGQAAFVASTGTVGRDDLAALRDALAGGRPATEGDLRGRSGLGAARLRRAADLLVEAGLVERRRRRLRLVRSFDPDEVPLEAEEHRAAREASRLE